MTDAKDDKDRKDTAVKRKEDVPLPFCREAADSEHHRGENEGEPCDDARAVEFETEQEEKKKQDKG